VGKKKKKKKNTASATVCTPRGAGKIMTGQDGSNFVLVRGFITFSCMPGSRKIPEK
jgi:hypothetical protein